jgi:hypothetical protein
MKIAIIVDTTSGIGKGLAEKLEKNQQRPDLVWVNRSFLWLKYALCLTARHQMWRYFRSAFLRMASCFACPKTAPTFLTRERLMPLPSG